MTDPEIWMHWAYVAIMFVSGVAFFVMSRNPRGVPPYKYAIHMFIVLWSGLAYSAMALNQGYVGAGEEMVVYARYADWVVSTPLLLLSLALTATIYLKPHLTLIGVLVFAQVVMITTGLVAELSREAVQYYWYMAGCIALVVVLYVFWQPLARVAKASGDPEAYRVYRYSAIYLSVQWVLYPLVWLVGSMGIGVLDRVTTTTLFIILPIISKAGFGFFNLILLRSMDKRHATDTPDVVFKEELYPKTGSA